MGYAMCAKYRFGTFRHKSKCKNWFLEILLRQRFASSFGHDFHQMKNRGCFDESIENSNGYANSILQIASDIFTQANLGQTKNTNQGLQNEIYENSTRWSNAHRIRQYRAGNLRRINNPRLHDIFKHIGQSIVTEIALALAPSNFSASRQWCPC